MSFNQAKLLTLTSRNNAGEVIDKTYWGSGGELLYTCSREAMPSDFSNFPAHKRTTEVDLLLTRNGRPYIHKPLVNSIYSNVVQRISIKPDNCRDFVRYALESEVVNFEAQGVSIPSFNFGMWGSLRIPHPPLPTQIAIANFLDRETAKIDELIANLEKLIALLKEKRQAVISNAVTKGLNPNAKMKDSGIDWIGEIPEHWEVVPLKKLIRVASGKDTKSDNGNFPLHGANGIIGTCEAPTLAGGEVLIGRVGSAGAVNRTTGPSGASDNVLIVDCRNIDQDFSYWLLTACKLSEGVSTNAQPLITGTYIHNLRFPAPRIHDEQREISRYLAGETSSIDTSSELCARLVSLLKEKRAALISAAVTGQIEIAETTGEAA